MANSGVKRGIGMIPTNPAIPGPNGSVAVKDTSKEGGYKWAPLNNGGPILFAGDYGPLDPTGTVDSSLAVQAAINALPPTGGTVFTGPGVFLMKHTITVGNGSTSGVSRRTGVILQGSAAPQGLGVITDVDNPAGTVNGTCQWISGAAVPMITILGPLDGWGVHNIHLNGNNLGTYGLQELGAQGGFSSGCIFTYFTVCGQYTSTVQVTGESGNHMHNRYRDFVYIPSDTNGSSCLTITANSPYSFDSCYDVWDGVTIWLANTVSVGHTVSGIRLAAADNERINDVEILCYPANWLGTVYELVYDYSGIGYWPTDCIIDHIDFGTSQAGTIVNVGTPLYSPQNRIIGCATTNGIPPNPNLSGLIWEQLDLPNSAFNMNSQRISSLAAGVASTDAANISQLPGAVLINQLGTTSNDTTGTTINTIISNNVLNLSATAVSLGYANATGYVQVAASGGVAIIRYTGAAGSTLTGLSLVSGSGSWTVTQGSSSIYPGFFSGLAGLYLVTAIGGGGGGGGGGSASSALAFQVGGGGGGQGECKQQLLTLPSSSFFLCTVGSGGAGANGGASGGGSGGYGAGGGATTFYGPSSTNLVAAGGGGGAGGNANSTTPALGGAYAGSYSLNASGLAGAGGTATLYLGVVMVGLPGGGAIGWSAGPGAAGGGSTTTLGGGAGSAGSFTIGAGGTGGGGGASGSANGVSAVAATSNAWGAGGGGGGGAATASGVGGSGGAGGRGVVIVIGPLV
jgi:hypothetical protein